MAAMSHAPFIAAAGPKFFGLDSFEGLPSTSFLKFMSHTCVANLAQYYGVRGRVVSTCAACVSGSQSL